MVKKLLSVILCLAVALAGFAVAPPQPAAALSGDNITRLVAQLEGVYYWLGEDAAGRQKVSEAREALDGLSVGEIQDVLWGSGSLPQLSASVVNEFGSQETAQEAVCQLICDMTGITLSDSISDLVDSLLESSSYTEDRQIVSRLLPGITADRLFEFLSCAQSEGLQYAVSDSNDWVNVFQSGDYGSIRSLLKELLSGSLYYAGIHGYGDVYNALCSIGWSVDDLAAAEEALLAEVDSDCSAEVALLKAYVRSRVHFSEAAATAGAEDALNVKSGGSVSGEITIDGVLLGDKLTCVTSGNSSIATASYDSASGKTVIAGNATGSTELIFRNSQGSDWVYRLKVNVTTSAGGGGGGGGGAASATTPTLPEDQAQVNQQVQNSLSQALQQAAANSVQAAQQVAAVVQAAVQAQTALTADTVQQISQTLEAVVQYAGQLPAEALESATPGTYAINTAAAWQQVAQLAQVLQSAQQAVSALAGAGIEVPLPTPVLTVQVAQQSDQGEAAVTVPPELVSRLAAVSSTAEVKMATPVAALAVPVAVDGGLQGNPWQVSFRQVSSPALTAAGGQVAGSTVEVAVTAGLGDSARVVSSFTVPVILYLPYRAGFDPDTLGVYRVLDDGQVQYVGGRVMSDGTVAVRRRNLSTYTVLSYSKSFTDTEAHWAKEVIKKMASRHVAAGVDENRFDPDGSVTRAQFAALLVRTLGLDENTPTGAVFKDVPENAWFAGAVETACARGLVSGMGDGSFAPNDRITREQMAVMLSRALQFCGKSKSLTGAQAENILSAYSDQNRISGWARSSLAEAISCGLLKGRSADELAPAGNATRAESVVMLYNLLGAADIY